MAYMIAVWEGDRPADADGAAVFNHLYDTYVGAHDTTPPTPAIREYVDALLDRWYELGHPDDVDDISPFSDSPLINNAIGPLFYFAVRYSMAEEVSATCVQMAVDRGLVCFDCQWDQLRPPTTEP